MIVSNAIAPYRVNLHRLIAAGIPELKLHTLITHGVSDFDWQVQMPPEIHVHNVSAPGEHALDNPLRRAWSEFRKGARLIRYLNEHNIRAVLFNGYRYIPYVRLMNYCHRHQIPFLYRSDSNIRDESHMSFIHQSVKRTIYGWWMKRASGVLSMGRLGDQFFIKYGADPHRIYRVPYWPDFDSFARVEEVGLERLRREFGLRNGRRNLLFSGRLVPEKRVDLLIDAFAAIANQRPQWDLLIVGDGVLRDELQRRVPEALRSRVTWTGFLDGPELALAYHAADVLVLPSDHEPWALVVQEAMAAGLAVVASDVVGAAYELVTDGVSGRIFPAGDCSALQKALEDVMHDERIDAYKREATTALEAYREQVDPVREIRRALVDANVLHSLASNIQHPTSNIQNRLHG
jgi:glycosyltransferase involved in cell wall biosynthesis